MTRKLLLVEPSATMRYVLENYAQSLGFEVVATGDYKQAETSLLEQYRSYAGDFAGVLLGWSVMPDAAADALTATLESQDFSDLPVIVMSTDMRAETRAWVSGREHTAVLPWKDYLAVDGLLERLLQTPGDQGDTFNSKFDNADINVLIVDDSVSIRFALRDLFELQGYKVSVASGHDEALAAARQSAFDIAVLDFYLQDGTGDALCRKLIADPATGHLTCAMLTGTYADHIIKRSLRAGAVECMFKNESSELLLARIDALSRFVRQRKRLAEEQQRLDGIVDSLAGATLVIDRNDRIGYASRQACSLLGYESVDALLDVQAGQLLDLSVLRASADGKFRAQWRDAANGLVNVVYRQIRLDDLGDLILNFKLLPGSEVDNKQRVSETSAENVVNALKLSKPALPFVSILQSYSSGTIAIQESVSLLLIDTFFSNSDRSDIPTNLLPGLSEHIESELKNVYKRENHVAHLSNNRYGFLLRHTTEPQAYLLTRKVMQLCNAIDFGAQALSISSTGCLFSVSKNTDKSAAQTLQLAIQGLNAVNARGKNQALLLDLRRMLPVYATE